MKYFRSKIPKMKLPTQQKARGHRTPFYRALGFFLITGQSRRTWWKSGVLWGSSGVPEPLQFVSVKGTVAHWGHTPYVTRWKRMKSLTVLRT